MLKERGLVREGELVVVVSDLRPRDEVRSRWCAGSGSIPCM